MNRGRTLGPGRLRKRGDAWELAWTDEHGRRRRKVVGRDRRTAEHARAAIVRQRDLARLGLGNETGQEMPVAELAELYLADLKPRVSSRHYTNVAAGLEIVLDDLGDVRVGSLRQVDAVRIRSAAVAQGLSNRSANLRVDRLRAALNWGRESGLISTNSLQYLRRLPEGAGHRRYERRALTEDEVQRLVAAAEADDLACETFLFERRGRRSRIPQTPLLIALLESAARWGEIRRVAWSDVDLGRRVMVLRAEHTKSRRQRAVPLRQGLVDRLRELRAVQAEVLGRLPTVTDRVFLSPDGCAWPWHSTNIMRILDRLLVASGIPKVDVEGRKLDVHALRHTAATRMARSGVPLMHAQQILGHSDPKLTAAVYSHLEAEDVRASVESLPPCTPPSAQDGVAREAR